MRHARIVLPCLGALWLTACAHWPRERSDDAVRARWTLSASSSVNPGAQGQSAPVLVRLYALAQRDAFDQATFFELYDHDQTVLGRSALARSVIVLRPGERIRLDEPLDARTRALAIVAAYRRIDTAHWRAIVDVDPSASRDVELAAVFAGDGVTVRRVPQAPPVDDDGLVGRFVKPLWKKLTDAIGAARK
ncbi:type VI secretion system lipoprotein TssJ [Trinickia diaoshuihuensis]|uniref:type VI secretion system lipoprotein TssJ n=1 Tax=Trinickia diaoshuihuensis TaxID=2292265 RepID=UPI000E2223ED|nr:type VI secretion system lipoprotein TssJ [Trinickia diaoshuihuensis]